MPVMSQTMPPEVAAEKLYRLANRYGTKTVDDKKKSEGEGSDRYNFSQYKQMFSVKLGKLELTAIYCMQSSSCGNFSVSGADIRFSEVEYRRNGRAVFCARRTYDGERYEDHLVSGESKTESIPSSGWKIDASENTKTKIAQIVEELERKVRKRKLSRK